MIERRSIYTRQTKETDISVSLNVDGSGDSVVTTGIGFLDHMIDGLAKHGRFDIELTCRGDLEVDDHHTAEDCAIALGSALDRALGDRSNITRFGSAYAPLDEALARSVVDLVERPSASIDLKLTREAIGGMACENVTHFLQTLASAGRFCLHVDVLKGENDHHRIEAAFKSFALALRAAFTADNTAGVPSTKGRMS